MRVNSINVCTKSQNEINDLIAKTDGPVKLTMRRTFSDNQKFFPA